MPRGCGGAGSSLPLRVFFFFFLTGETLAEPERNTCDRNDWAEETRGQPHPLRQEKSLTAKHNSSGRGRKEIENRQQKTKTGEQDRRQKPRTARQGQGPGRNNLQRPKANKRTNEDNALKGPAQEPRDRRQKHNRQKSDLTKSSTKHKAELRSSAPRRRSRSTPTLR